MPLPQEGGLARLFAWRSNNDLQVHPKATDPPFAAGFQPEYASRHPIVTDWRSFCVASACAACPCHLQAAFNAVGKGYRRRK
jgi:hypothetical protein